jgi:catechol 2,3-dioxygenase-like lactoylglutathione lyase family enzyme
VESVEIVLHVSDMERAVGFYRNTIGLEVEFESENWATFRTGACTLALQSRRGRESGVGEPDPTLRVGNAATERERLSAAGVAVTEIRGPVAGVQVFDVRDPDGNRISLESRS